MTEPNRRFTDKDLDLILEKVGPQKPANPEAVGGYVGVARDWQAGKRPSLEPESSLYGLGMFLDIMDVKFTEKISDEDLSRLVYRAEDIYSIDLELIQDQLNHQIDLNWEAGRYSVFGSYESLGHTMREGLRLGFFREVQEEVNDTRSDTRGLRGGL